MNRIYILLLIVAALSGCIKEIDLRTKDNSTETLVVEGDFTDANGPHRLLLTRTNRFNLSIFQQVSDAEVWIYDDMGNRAQYRIAFEPGLAFYELQPGAMPAVKGRSYQVEIRLSDGTIYRSQPQKMPARVEADSLTAVGKTVARTTSADVVVEDRRAFINLFTRIPNDGEDYYFRWDAHAVFYFPEVPLPGPLPPPTKQCYVSDFFNRQQIVVQSAKGQGGKAIEKEIGNKLFDFSFDYLQYFNVVQRSIGSQAFSYWEKIGKLANPQGTVFDVPPAPARGNIFNPNDEADAPLGFFEVAAVDTVRLKVFNGHFGPDFYAVPKCSMDDYYFSRDPECFDCLLLKNSTLQKPPYWMP